MPISRRVYLKMRFVVHAVVLIKKALLQKCLLKTAFSAVRLSLSTSTFLKTLYFASHDCSRFAFIGIFMLLNKFQ